LDVVTKNLAMALSSSLAKSLSSLSACDALAMVVHVNDGLREHRCFVLLLQKFAQIAWLLLVDRGEARSQNSIITNSGDLRPRRATARFNDNNA
jgi:hypothetical protein